MVAGSENYNVKVYINGSLNATYVPFEWNTTKLADGWWNVTVIATDITTNSESKDEVLVYVKNAEDIVPRVMVYKTSQQFVQNGAKVQFEAEKYDSSNSFNLNTETYTVPSDGYYFIYTSINLIFNDLVNRVWLNIRINGVNTLSNSAYGLSMPTLILTEILWLNQTDTIIVYVWSGSPNQYSVIYGEFNYNEGLTSYIVIEKRI